MRTAMERMKNGKDYTEKDIDKSIEWFTKAADQGLMGSATTLAMIYEEGKLVPQDLEKSQYWYKKAGIEKP